MTHLKAIAILLLLVAVRTVEAQTLEGGFSAAESMVHNFHPVQQRPPPQPMRVASPPPAPRPPLNNPPPLQPEQTPLPPRPAELIIPPRPQSDILNFIDPFGDQQVNGSQLPLPTPRDPTMETENALNPFTDRNAPAPMAVSSSTSTATPDNALNPYADQGVQAPSIPPPPMPDETIADKPIGLWDNAPATSASAEGTIASVAAPDDGTATVPSGADTPSTGSDQDDAVQAQKEHCQAEIDRLDKLETGLEKELAKMDKESESQQENSREVLQIRHEVFVDGTVGVISSVSSAVGLKLDADVEAGKVSPKTAKEIEGYLATIQSSAATAAAFDAARNNDGSEEANQRLADKNIDAANAGLKMVLRNSGKSGEEVEMLERVVDFDTAYVKAVKTANEKPGSSEKANEQFRDQVDNVVHMAIPLMPPPMKATVEISEQTINLGGNGYTYYKAQQALNSIQEASANVHNAQTLLEKHLRDCERQKNDYQNQLSGLSGTSYRVVH